MPKKLDIVIDPNVALRKKSAPFAIDKIKIGEIKALIRDMTETMLGSDGVGLAAPQIGKNIRLIVANTKDGPIAVINPRILRRSLLKEWGEEGCLSVPGVFGQVKRHKRIVCEYYDGTGRKKKIDARGFMARILQHEIDHLDGILFIDQAKDLVRK